MAEKKHLLGMTFDELKEVAHECGLPRFAAKQIADWLYKKKVTDIGQMTNISLANRTLLEQNYDVGRIPPAESKRSVDGTVKYLFPAGNGKSVEAVMIPDDDRYTLCVSSQVGCKFNCLFCMTGKQGFSGNLTSNQIINQICSVAEADKLTNIVFMGMGEPLDNYPQVKQAIDIITADYGFAWSPKRITLSTTGVTPKLKLFLDETSAHLAISLHSPFAGKREEIMPCEKSYPLSEVLSLLRGYDWSKQRRLSFEYIMFSGFNDSPAHARELVKILSALDCRVNLIRYHAIPGVDLRTSAKETMESFRDYLTSKGLTCTIRSSRGEDIFAACGMLSTLKNKKETIQEKTK
ncbi:23S rRNA (adenine2503-C2)-methyltransferase [Dysgonomonas sp. PH5-45]|uniref:23S rRNA (adenine(2503)-C(2))-methyltransferase RlmN n=1 Tax=unclassified Dysgonomonas TaxID=2630389 RepID=UPI0024733387|nr:MULTISPECIES: 23S rRNA (adenine(2503)-C(2))-methyltransferase RlmN [unclassified Dysgonomonas]MDH6354915.1 23S rRNA (adenine2503-C2)-methyltransferase [Dysgonomonas sp. PH5-45]MDH6387814.1 23S rRNA (adenine2503-C2)-methyltransferase [Dysgonomonas sp. PH5-37]